MIRRYPRLRVYAYEYAYFIFPGKDGNASMPDQVKSTEEDNDDGDDNVYLCSRNNQHNAQVCTTPLFIYAGSYMFRYYCRNM
jgi:hypothetical protein